MKTVKLYQWKGVGSLSLLLIIDGKKKEIEFPTGTEKPRVNARLETDDPAIQAKIEATHFFATGQIKLLSTRNIAEPSDAAKQVEAPKTAASSGGKPTAGAGAKAAPKTEASNVFPAVTNYQQAGALLVDKFGADQAQMQDPEAIMAKAAEVGATFPNLIE